MMRERGKAYIILCLVTMVAAGGVLGCSTMGTMPSDTRGMSRESGKAFLVEDQVEARGYGLYSYLLIGSPPADDAQRKRYLQAITDCVTMIVDISELQRYVPPKELNVLYLPINLPPPPRVSPQWLLDHYNYARARSLLRKLEKPLYDGPYIISTLRPLSIYNDSPDKYLFQDMSSCPPSVVSFWVKEFIKQAAKERFWEEETTKRLSLQLRKSIAIFAEAMPEIKKGLADNISWIRSLN